MKRLLPTELRPGGVLVGEFLTGRRTLIGACVVNARAAANIRVGELGTLRLAQLMGRCDHLTSGVGLLYSCLAAKT